ncbi:NAD(P)H-dependent oxidoreductase [Mycolicibacterium aubagnense]
MIPKILVFAGSIRSGAFSGRTADVAQKALAMQGADVTRISLADYPMPIFDEDIEKETGIPENVMKLARLLGAHDGLLLVTPEYNGSVSPLLKNAVDWISIVRHDGGRQLKPMAGKTVALCSSSKGHFAGVRAINHLRAILLRCHMDIVTPECSVPNGASAFDADGNLVDERLRHAMDLVAQALVERARQTMRG